MGWLEEAVPRDYFNCPFLRAHDRFVAPLRGHPRFERLLDVVKRKREAYRA